MDIDNLLETLSKAEKTAAHTRNDHDFGAVVMNNTPSNKEYQSILCADGWERRYQHTNLKPGRG